MILKYANITRGVTKMGIFTNPVEQKFIDWYSLIFAVTTNIYHHSFKCFKSRKSMCNIAPLYKQLKTGRYLKTLQNIGFENIMYNIIHTRWF